MKIVTFAACLAMSLLPVRAVADPTVTFTPATNDNGSPSGHATITLVNGKWNISITKDYFEPADIDAWIDEPVDTTLDGFVNNEDLADVVDAVANGG